MYEWMADNQLIAHIVVAEPANAKYVGGVPAHLLTQESLTLNISPAATQSLTINNEYIEFHARFAGQSHQVWIAIAAVIAIYDRDSQQGLSFALEPLAEELPEKAISPETEVEKNAKAKASHLKIIK